jgi:hypothetical protein
MRARRSEGEPREDHPATHRHRGRRGSAGGQPGPGPDHGQRLHRCTHRDGQFTDVGHLVPGDPVTVGEPVGARPQRDRAPLLEHGRQRQPGQRDVAALASPGHRLPHGRCRGPVAATGGKPAIPAGATVPPVPFIPVTGFRPVPGRAAGQADRHHATDPALLAVETPRRRYRPVGRALGRRRIQGQVLPGLTAVLTAPPAAVVSRGKWCTAATPAGRFRSIPAALPRPGVTMAAGAHARLTRYGCRGGRALAEWCTQAAGAADAARVRHQAEGASGPRGSRRVPSATGNGGWAMTTDQTRVLPGSRPAGS